MRTAPTWSRRFRAADRERASSRMGRASRVFQLTDEGGAQPTRGNRPLRLREIAPCQNRAEMSLSTDVAAASKEGGALLDQLVRPGPPDSKAVGPQASASGGVCAPLPHDEHVEQENGQHDQRIQGLRVAATAASLFATV